MENSKEFYAVLAVALVAIVSVVFLITTIAPFDLGGSNGMTGAVVGNQPQKQIMHSVPVDWGRLLIGMGLGAVCVGIIYNMYKKNE